MLFIQVTVFAPNTPKLYLVRTALGADAVVADSVVKVGCGIGATQDTVLPSSLYSNLIGSRVQID